MAWNDLLELFFPKRCAGCEEKIGKDRDWCFPCQAGLVSGLDARCHLCGKIFLNGQESHLCGDCLRERPSFSLARSAYAYGGPLQEAIVKWKNRPDESMGPALIRLGSEAWLKSQEVRDFLETGSTVVTSLPSSLAHLRKRGFNPAAVLGKAWAKDLGLPFQGNLLRYAKEAPESKGLSRAERKKRMKGNLEVRGGLAHGLQLLLVDDVVTTGGSIEEAGRALKAGGALELMVLSLAGVPGHDRPRRTRQPA